MGLYWLSFKFQKKLALAEKELYKAEFSKAEEMIEDILCNEELTEEQRLTTLVLKCDLLNHKGDFKMALKIADEVIKASENKKTIFKVDALNQKAFALYFLGQGIENLNLYNEIETMIQEFDNLPEEVLDKRKMWLLYNKLNHYYFSGDIHNLKESSEVLISLAEKNKNDYFLFTGWNYFASVYGLMNDYDKFNEILTNKLSVFVNRADNKMMEILYRFLKVSFRVSNSAKDQQKKIEQIKKTITEIEAIGAKGWLGIMYNNLAIAYSTILETDKALECFHKANNLYEISFGKAINLLNIGYQYYIKRDLTTAQNYYQQSLETSKATKSFWWQGKALEELIRVTLDQNLLDQASSYLKDFAQISENVDHEAMTINYKIASALVLKESSRMKDWVKALDIYEELITKKLNNFQKLLVYFNASEILTKELQMTADQKTLEKLKENISIMIDIANKLLNYIFSIDLMRLQSKLALIEYNEEKAKQLLVDAKTIAEKFGLERFAAEIEVEEITLEKQKEFWQTSKQKDELLTERLQHVDIPNAMKQMKEKTVLEERNEETGQFIGQQKLFAIKF